MNLLRSLLATPLALVPLFALAGCSKSSPPTPASPPSVAPSSSTASAAPDPLVGAVAPDFSASAQDGSSVHLAALKGKPVVIYFYPKDETPGCTKEACSFRDSWDALGKTGATLIGISADTLDSHKEFAAHYKLPFLLVSDPHGDIAKLYGVPFSTVHRRQTVVVGADGNVRSVYRTVDVGVHAQEVLHDLG